MEIAVVVAVAAVVVGSLVAGGLFGGGHGSPGLDLPYSQARQLALAAADDYLPGTRVVVGAFGLDVRSGTTVATTNLTGVLGANCSFSPLVGEGFTSSIAVPAYAGPFSAGVAPLWALVLAESSSSSVLLVLVVNASARPVATVSGADCSAAQLASHALPNDTADSPVAAAAAWGYAGQSWTSTAGTAVSGVLLVAIGGGSYDGFSYGASWITAYVPCDPLVGGNVSSPAEVVVAPAVSGEPTLSATHDVGCPE